MCFPAGCVFFLNIPTISSVCAFVFLFQVLFTRRTTSGQLQSKENNFDLGKCNRKRTIFLKSPAHSSESALEIFLFFNDRLIVGISLYDSSEEQNDETIFKGLKLHSSVLPCF